MRKLMMALVLTGLTLTLTPTAPAQARDGERAYEMACSLMWMAGNITACRELPWHPCRPSNPNRPSACDGPKPEEPHPRPNTFDEF